LYSGPGAKVLGDGDYNFGTSGRMEECGGGGKPAKAAGGSSKIALGTGHLIIWECYCKENIISFYLHREVLVI